MAFHSVDTVFWCTKIFNFDKVQSIYSFWLSFKWDIGLSFYKSYILVEEA